MNPYELEWGCCFTGHRPEKLKNDPTLVQWGLLREIDRAIADGITVFYSGMARGVDLWAAALVLERKKKHPELKLVCAIPYEGFENSWAEKWQSAYRSIRAAADGEIVFFPQFHYGAFNKRNFYMVDHSIRVIAVYNGEKGGTRNTVEYAEKQNVEICYVEA